MSTSNKIRATHLERMAIIYVRQSTPAQVRDNPESRARQYALVEEAAQLGWPASKIEVIDADLGISGRSAERRSGFREVVSRVCLGEVGAIFGLEVSRLARSNADFARLLELARLTDTLRWSANTSTGRPSTAIGCSDPPRMGRVSMAATERTPGIPATGGRNSS